MLEVLDELTLNCIKCGYCKAPCPVYREINEEPASPRGRVRLVRGVSTGEQSLSSKYRSLIDLCISCRACTVECPSGVRPNQAILVARHHIGIERGLPLAKRIIFRRLMTARRMFPNTAKLLGVLQRLVLIRSPYSPARVVLPIVGLPINKAIPNFQIRTLRDRLPKLITATDRKYRVAYFVGCGADLLYPEIGEAVVGLLNHFGVEVVIPDQMCCGTPVFTSGDFDAASRLARFNIEQLSTLDVDAIITACGSCGTSIKHEWRDLLHLDVPDSLTTKVYDIAQFLTQCLGVNIAGDLGAVTTYHDSCHLLRGMNVGSEPRLLLRSISEYVEMPSAETCCGAGGAYSIYHPDISRKIGMRKAESILTSGADLIATGCPVCVLQIREMLSLARQPREVQHTAVVLWKAISQKTSHLANR